MDERRIVLVNLAKGHLGALDCRLLGMLVLGKLFSAALQRTEAPQSHRPPFYLYVDEAHNFTTDTVGDMMAEARKFGLHLILANQNLSQLTVEGQNETVLDALLGNVGTLLLFRLGVVDSDRMARYTKPELEAQDLQNLPDFQAAARLLVRGQPTRPFILDTYPPIEQGRTGQSRLSEGVLEKNRRAYTRSADAVDQELLERRRQYLLDAPST